MAARAVGLATTGASLHALRIVTRKGSFFVTSGFREGKEVVSVNSIGCMFLSGIRPHVMVFGDHLCAHSSQ